MKTIRYSRVYKTVTLYLSQLISRVNFEIVVQFDFHASLYKIPQADLCTLVYINYACILAYTYLFVFLFNSICIFFFSGKSN